VSTKPPIADSEDVEKDADEGHRNKRLKKERDGPLADRDLGKAMTNPNPVKEWLVTRSYRKIFHKGVNKNTPQFNGERALTVTLLMTL
jgi:hypothetical protein